MSPQLATLIFAVAIVGLFALDRDKSVRVQRALWIPTIWLLISGSRNVGQWLQLGSPVDQDQAYLEGNPVDRAVLGLLIALGLVVLFQRRNQVLAILRSNPAILCYFVYCGISCIWSDYPDVSAKRWIRSLGDVVVVLIISTGPNVLAGLKKLFARVGFLLLPISVLFIRYYPDLGRAYGYHSGALTWTGVTTEKNTLGLISVIYGLASGWRLIEAYRERKNPARIRTLIAHGVMLLIAMYLLYEADSATSKACFVLAGGVMLVTSLRAIVRKPVLVHLIVGGVVVGAFCVLFLGIGADLLSNLGRNSTLTGRTDIWRLAIGLGGSPLWGTGFESFWMGKRLATMRVIYGDLNQVHNGYLEIFLNLGWLGVIFLAGIIVSGYRKAIARVRRLGIASNLMLAFFVVAIIHNFTEASFKMMFPVWIVLLLTITFPYIPIKSKRSSAGCLQTKADPRFPVSQKEFATAVVISSSQWLATE